MSRKSKGIVTVEAEVDIDCAEVIDHCSTEDLIDELHRRDQEGVSVAQDPVRRIWDEVMRHGRDLEDVVDDIMRERTWPWRRGGAS